MSGSLRRGGSVLLLVPLLALAACGQVRDRQLCRQYEDFQASVAQVQTLDPQTATSEDIRAIADDVLANLDQLLAASDGVYDGAISTLRASLTTLREAAVDLDTNDLQVARPLLQDAWDRVVVDYQVLTQRLDVVCPTN
jgi:hypothetical protein